MRWSTSLYWPSGSDLAAAGPVEFGLREYDAAVAARNLKWKVKYELTLDPPETFRIEPYKAGGAHVTGGDLRGLMYGLARSRRADPLHRPHLKQVHAAPATPVRGVRMFATPAISMLRILLAITILNSSPGIASIASR